MYQVVRLLWLQVETRWISNTKVTSTNSMETASLSSHGESISRTGTHSPAVRFDASSSDDSEVSRARQKERKHEENVKKGQHCWELLQKSVHDAITLVQDSDIAELSINHGVHHERSIGHHKPVEHIMYNPTSKARSHATACIVYSHLIVISAVFWS